MNKCLFLTPGIGKESDPVAMRDLCNIRIVITSQL